MSTIEQSRLPLPLTAHQIDCPANRVESYEAQRPMGEEFCLVTVIRCADCGGQEVRDGGIADVYARSEASRTKGND